MPGAVVSKEIDLQDAWLPNVTACQVHLEFLEAVVGLEDKVKEWSKTIKMEGPEVWDLFVALAAERFLQWVKEKDDSLPPLDILMVWHAFMLNPRAYLQFENLILNDRLVGKGIDWTALHRFLDSKEIPQNNSTCFPDLLASLQSEVTTREDLLEKVQTRQPLHSFDLVAAVHRQFVFAAKMCSYNLLHSPFMHTTLLRAIDRYKKFMSLIAASPGTMLAPTLDIDLVWHTHQLSPEIYRAYSRIQTGSFINHDDTVEAEALVSSSNDAQTLFQERFEEEYFICFCWHCEAERGETTVAELQKRPITCQELYQKRPDSPPRSGCSGSGCSGSNCSSGCSGGDGGG